MCHVPLIWVSKEMNGSEMLEKTVAQAGEAATIKEQRSILQLPETK
jgi:hypothetical protein